MNEQTLQSCIIIGLFLFAIFMGGVICCSIIERLSLAEKECNGDNVSDEHIVQIGNDNYSCGYVRAINTSIQVVK